MRKSYYAVHDFEIIPCHLIAKKDRKDGRKYKADSRRDNRRFLTAYADREQARAAVEEYERYIEQ